MVSRIRHSGLFSPLLAGFSTLFIKCLFVCGGEVKRESGCQVGEWGKEGNRAESRGFFCVSSRSESDSDSTRDGNQHLFMSFLDSGPQHVFTLHPPLFSLLSLSLIFLVSTLSPGQNFTHVDFSHCLPIHSPVCPLSSPHFHVSHV